MITKSQFEIHRPEGFQKQEVQALNAIGNKLFSVLRNTQKSLVHDTLYLPKHQLEELCIAIVEFTEDIINDVGIWYSLELYNQKFFGTPLPIILPKERNMPTGKINKYRIHYFLWNKYQEFCDDLLVSPAHKDLLKIVVEISNFFDDETIDKFPQESSLCHFFSQSNQYAWDVKKKLLWLGTHSYLFRKSFEKHMRDSTSLHEIQVIDDFICQDASQWSGLGVIDILAVILDITVDQRNDLQNWYQRHFAYYKIESIDGGILLAENIINNKRYEIRVGELIKEFKLGHIYTGGVVPWNGEWYWSGQQFGWGSLSQKELNNIQKEFLEKHPQIAYRYCDNLLESAKKSVHQHYQNFVNFHGNDLAVFPDGYSMAAALQKEHRLQYESQLKESVEHIKKKYNLKKASPSYSYPKEILESENGIGVFFNKLEGMEIMLEFKNVLSGMKKCGTNLTNEEQECIRGFVYSHSISHQFVKKIAEQYGAKSIAVAFLIDDVDDIDFLQFLLRKYKGHTYRTIYPNLTIH